MGKLKRKISLILVGILLVMCIPANIFAADSLEYQVSFYGKELQVDAYKMLGKVNKRRSSASVASLKWDAELETAARTRAVELAFKFDGENRPNGTKWSTVSSKVRAVRIAVFSNEQTVDYVDEYFASNSTRVNSQYKSYAAAAFKTESGCVYWVEMFGENAKNNNDISSGVQSFANQTIDIRDTSASSISAKLVTIGSGNNINSTTFEKNETFNMKLILVNTINPEKNFKDNIAVFNSSGNIFTSSNPSVATVDSAGQITCLNAGQTTIRGKLHGSSSYAGSVTITVKNTAISSPLTVVFKNGSSIIRQQTIEAGSSVTPPAISKEGYKFSGWYTAQSGGSKVTSFSNITSNLTLYARFVEDTAPVYVTVMFKSDSYTIDKKTIASGSSVTPPSPALDGYIFEGWYTAQSGGTKITNFSNITKDLTVYARFTKNNAETKEKVKVVFKNSSKIVKSQTIDYGSSAAPPTVKKTGYTFVGWYTANTGGKKITSFKNIKSNITVYARFGKNPGKTTLKLKSPKKAQIKVNYKKVSKATGYQVYYRAKSGKLMKKLYQGKKITFTKKLKSKNTYYVKVRAYTTNYGVKCYAPWSKVKKIKLK